MRDKLIQILRTPIFPHELADPTEAVADYLLDNDVVPVVRCKDCACYEETCPGYGYCYHWDFEQGMSPNQVESDDFCSYGERREGDG